MNNHATLCAAFDSCDNVFRKLATKYHIPLINANPPGTGNGFSGGMINYNAKIYFSADDGTHGIELWETDGTVTGTLMVKDINIYTTAGGHSSPSGFVVYNNLLYFNASDTAQNRELWKSDGTAAGTTMVKDLLPGNTYSSNPSQFIVYKKFLYFIAKQGLNDGQLWQSDGTAAGTKVVAAYPVTDAIPVANVRPIFLNPADSTLYFAARYDATGIELWSLKETTITPPPPPPSVVPALNSDIDFLLYPNPSNGIFTLDLGKVYLKNASVQVYDMMGRECYRATVTNSKTEIILNQPKGIYMVKLQLDETILTKRVIVE